MSELHRGEIYYISRGGATPRGNEQYTDRPAVIVSNEKNNEHSGTVEIVYMTTQPKNDLPTHTTIRSTGRTSTVLCEQINSVSVGRLGEYIGEVSEQEMKNIDIALMISLQLDGDIKTSKQYNETIRNQQEEIEHLKGKIEKIEKDRDMKIEQIEQDAAVYVEENKKIAKSEDTIRLQTERDTYKAMYEQLLEKLVKGGAA
jgi:mRNA interferase MazF